MTDDHFHVGVDSAAVDQAHAEAMDMLRRAEAYMLITRTPDGETTLLGGTRRGPTLLAVLLRVALDTIYENAVLVAEQIEEDHVRENALRDLAEWEPKR